MSKPHDAYFKRVFGRPGMAADLLRRRLPPALIARLDLDRCEPVAADFIDRALRNRRADLIFRVPLNDGSDRVAFVFVLIEHQSRPDPLMPFRVLVYVVETLTRYIERHRAEHGRPPRSLPAVIPLVVHQGERRWTGPRTMAELIDLPDDLPPVLGPYLPQLELLIDDLAVPDDDRTGTTRLALTAAALLTLRYVRGEADPHGFLRRWSRLIDASRGEPGRDAIIAAVAEYLYTVSDRLPPDALVEAIAATGDDKTQEALMTIAERLRAEGREQGIEQGIEQGQALILLGLVRRRFGEPGPELADRIRREAATESEPWIERILAATTLAELERSAAG